jgi:hypothetical protein
MLGPVEMVCELAHASRQFDNASQQKMVPRVRLGLIAFWKNTSAKPPLAWDASMGVPASRSRGKAGTQCQGYDF